MTGDLSGLLSGLSTFILETMREQIEAELQRREAQQPKE